MPLAGKRNIQETLAIIKKLRKMINWLRKKLGIDRIDENIIENNSETKNQLVEIQNSIKI